MRAELLCFCVEISTFSLPWHRGLYWQNFTCTLKSAVSENLYLAQESHTQAELLPTFWWNLPIFVTMATKVGLAKIWMTPLDWPTTKTPTQVQNSGIYLKCELSYCVFVWKFPHFRYNGNGGWTDTNFTCTVISAIPENPYMARES